MNSACAVDKGEDGATSAGLASPLLLAVFLKHLPIVDLLLRRGADPDWARPHNGSTATFVAAQSPHEEVVRVLAEHGANLDTPNTRGRTPVWIAAQSNHVEVVRVLASHGANLNTPTFTSGSTPACVAAQEGRAHVMRVLAEHGANLDTPDNGGLTPIYVS